MGKWYIAACHSISVSFSIDSELYFTASVSCGGSSMHFQGAGTAIGELPPYFMARAGTCMYINLMHEQSRI